MSTPSVHFMLLGLILLVDLTRCSRILLVSQQLHSHLAESQEIGVELVARGHRVYLLVERGYAHLERVLRPGIKVIAYEALPRPDSISSEYLMNLVMEPHWIDPTASYFAAKAHHDCKSMIRDEQLMATLAGMNFDMAVAGTLLLCPCMALIPYALRVPFVALSATLDAWVARVPAHPSITPVRIFKASHDMSISQKLINLITMFAVEVLQTLARADVALLHEVAPMVGSWNSLLRRADLFLCPTDHLLEWPRATMPHVLHTPGITTLPAKVLPEDLQRILTSNNSTVIVVSLGSFTGDLPRKTIEKFAQAFARVHHIVIWKFVGPRDTILPSNVYALPWLPQNDLLGDQRTAVFITHCGNNGQYEALYHGVPMIGFPLYGDQTHNAFRMQHHGYGIRLDILNFSPDQLVDAIHAVVHNPGYRVATRRASAIIRDRAMTSQQSAAYWIEHVLKFGSSHIRSRTVDMPFWEFFMLDIVAAITVSFLLLICLWKISSSFLLRRTHQCNERNEQ